MQTIAVLLTVYNRKEKTILCLHNLYAQLPIDGYEIDVYMTDDGSTDGTSEDVAEQFPKVKIIHSKGNLFWNRGMFTSWKTAACNRDYDYYLWLNNDTFIYDDAIIRLLNCSNEFTDKNIIVGTTCAVENTNVITYGGHKMSIGLLKPINKPQVCDYFNGNIVLFPQYVYKKIGMNDPIFHHALGDFDYGLRAKKLGINSIIVSGLVGECDKHETIGTWCNPKISFCKRLKAFRAPLGQKPEEFFIYEKRHHGLLSAIFHYMTNYLRILFPWIWSYKN
jgi:GT2 family glycosyltransferase